MYFVLAALFVGGAFGALRAKNRGGRPLDMAQYGGGYAILFGLITLVLVVIALRIG